MGTFFPLRKLNFYGRRIYYVSGSKFSKDTTTGWSDSGLATEILLVARVTGWFLSKPLKYGYQYVRYLMQFDACRLATSVQCYCSMSFKLSATLNFQMCFIRHVALAWKHTLNGTRMARLLDYKRRR
eukprot:3012782-Pyramimonas_sp.AAC.1